MDGEDRFFAGVFLCLGIALLWCARDVFFTGGIGAIPGCAWASSR